MAIRSGIKKIGRRLLGRGAPPRPERAPAPAGAAPFTERAPEPPEEEDEPDLEVEAEALRGWVDGGREVSFVDIREPYELSSGHVEGALLLPMNQVPHQLDDLPRDRTLIIYCAAGARSFGVTHFLREQGFEDSWSLAGGISAWIQQGGRWRAPAHGAPHKLLDPVRVRQDAAAARGQEAPAEGLGATVQCIYEHEGALRYDVRAAGVLLEGLRDDELSPIGRRPRS
jgi:rhodanese-related sulfurtransferase